MSHTKESAPRQPQCRSSAYDGFNPALIALADVLPAECYDPWKLFAPKDRPDEQESD